MRILKSFTGSVGWRWDVLCLCGHVSAAGPVSSSEEGVLYLEEMTPDCDLPPSLLCARSFLNLCIVPEELA